MDGNAATERVQRFLARCGEADHVSQEPQSALYNEAEGVLREKFGFPTFKEGQARVIKALLAGHNAAAIFPTGGGKSMCYQLPAMVLPHLTLVISPLIALQKDQVDFLRSKGLPAAHWNSTTESSAVTALKREIRTGELKLLFVAPEKLNNEAAMELFRSCTVSLLAIDEAHCISEWGHSFRPDYLKLERFAAELKCQVVCLTATATPSVEQDMRKAFSIVAENSVRTGFYRANLSFLVKATTTRDTGLVQTISDVRKKLPLGPVIVYTTTQSECERLATLLSECGVASRAYHGGMRADNRQEVQRWFCDEDFAVICATIAFGMGIDRSNLRCVVHYNLPKSLEGYSQEVGRAGRDGQPADCVVLFNPLEDVPLLSAFAFGPTPTLQAVRGIVASMMANTVGSIVGVSVYSLSKEFDVNKTSLDMIYAYMDIYHGAITQLTPSYSSYQWRIAEMGSLTSKGEPEVVAYIKRFSKKGRSLYTLPVSELPSRHDASIRPGAITRQDIARHLGMSGATTTGKGVSQNFRILAQVDVETMTDDIFRRMEERETSCLARLQQSRDLFASGGCLTLALMRYFGDTASQPETWRCGHCQSCGPDDNIRERQLIAKADEAHVAQLAKDFEAKSRELKADRNLPRIDVADARTLARYLMGCTSPGMPAKLGVRTLKDVKGLPFWEYMGGHPFSDVLELCRHTLCTPKKYKSN